MTFLTVSNVTKVFGSVAALRDVSVSVERGTLLALLGPSGCGKTTLLRAIAGLVRPDDGRISVASRDITSLAPNQRNVGMVFQDFALFPHMTVHDNVAFGLRMRRLEKKEIQTRVDEVLQLVQLTEERGRKPRQLSGGQQQRVALARALVTQPAVLLFDEPLGQLDAKLRKALQVWIRDLQRRLEITSVYVTHDQAEALSLADVIAVMHAGRIVQVGSPKEIYYRPSDGFAADFIGTCVRFRGTLELPTGQSTVGGFVSDLGERLNVELSTGGSLAGTVDVIVRPEDVDFVEPSAAGRAENTIEARVTELIFEGSTYTVRLRCRSGREIFLEKRTARWVDEILEVDKEVLLSIPQRRLKVVKPNSLGEVGR